MIHFSNLDYKCAFSENIKFVEVVSYLAGSLISYFLKSGKIYTIDPLSFLVGPRSQKAQKFFSKERPLYTFRFLVTRYIFRLE